jgi:adenosylhomocysteine nucleosidase
MPEIAIVAALEREIRPLVKGWPASEREHSGRRYRFSESGTTVAVCGGIGPEAARRAAEAVIALYKPAVVESVGFAGALDNTLRVGDVCEVRYVIDSSDGSRTDTGVGTSVLVSSASVASEEQKAKLAKAYGAQLVDMESAAVAKSAEAHGLPFRAVKVVSDEAGFPMPPMELFIGRDGSFHSGKFALHAAVRPWLWSTVFRLTRNSGKASRALCHQLKLQQKSTGLDSAPVPAAMAKDGHR